MEEFFADVERSIDHLQWGDFVMLGIFSLISIVVEAYYKKKMEEISKIEKAFAGCIEIFLGLIYLMCSLNVHHVAELYAMTGWFFIAFGCVKVSSYLRQVLKAHKAAPVPNPTRRAGGENDIPSWYRESLEERKNKS